MLYRIKYRFFSILFVVSAFFLLAGCNMTRYVPDGKYLVNDIDYKVDNRQINKEELSTYVRQDENLKILGFFKFHLWLYNLSRKDKPNGWLKEIGEPPAVYDELLVNKSISQIQQYLYNKGYYQAQVTNRVDLKSKKANIVFSVETGRPYLIQNITYRIKDERINDLVTAHRSESLIKEGDIFDVEIVDQERSRISRLLNNQGFYKFMNDYVHFKVDTLISPFTVTIEMIIDNPRSLSDPEKEVLHKQFFIKDYAINVFTPPKGISSINFQDFTDTLHLVGYNYLFNKRIPLKVKTISKTIDLEPGNLYSKHREERTQNNLYSLRQFKFVNIQYSEEPSSEDSLTGWLKGRIFLPMQVKQNYSFEIEGTNTASNLGIAGNLNYQHRNLFRGGEIFDITLKGATERQVTMVDDQLSEFDMNEYGTTVKLSIPGFWLPVNEKKFKLYSMPFTSFSASYNFQERPKFTRTILNATLGYQWRSSALYSHSFNLIDLNSVYIYRINQQFLDDIKSLYIKSSYTDHIISATSYSLVYNNQISKKRPDYEYFKMNIEVAGNLLWALSSLTGQKKYAVVDSVNSSSYYTLFGTRFAQYVKGDFEYRYGYRFDKYNLIATRAFLGVALPYGNFNVTPFEKSYYTGGANGIRAWPVRTIGPGSYRYGVIEDQNQTGDIKLEANVEYRFKLFWVFEGALFVDAGNIWAISGKDNREDAVFKFDRFYDEFAIGTGLGLRLVTNYFIVRTDLGLKLRDPAQDTGNRWIPGNRSFEKSDLNLNIAIGYPF